MGMDMNFSMRNDTEKTLNVIQKSSELPTTNSENRLPLPFSKKQGFPHLLLQGGCLVVPDCLDPK